MTTIITAVRRRVVYDSRGVKTIEVDVETQSARVVEQRHHLGLPAAAVSSRRRRTLREGSRSQSSSSTELFPQNWSAWT